MYKFDEAKVKQEVKNVLEARPEVEKLVDSICEEGIENLFLIGVGGTYAVNMSIEALMKSKSMIQVYNENAADLQAMGNPHLCAKSLVIMTSATGNTPEMNTAIDYVHAKGAKIIGFINEKESIMAKTVDYLFCVPGNTYFKMLTVVLRLMKNNGEFEDYDAFWAQAENLVDGIVEVQKNADAKTEAYAKTYCDEPITYVIGAGNLWGSAYSYAMCYLEEMFWVRTKSVTAADFFHGTLEVVDRDINVLIFAGEDESRVLTDRVINFVPRISRKVTVLDTKDYPIEGIDEKFRGILSPVIMPAIYGRLNIHIEEALKHPIEIRRYYRKLNY